MIAIDQIDFDFEVLSESKKIDNSKAPADGAYIHGLFLEGCRWNQEQDSLSESFPKVLYSQMPMIWLKPMKVSEIETRHVSLPLLFNYSY